MLLRKTFRFEASHVLPKHPGKCSRLHGHSWVLHVFVEGPLDKETGFVMDYAIISNYMQGIMDALDHRHLNDFIEYPSSELVLYWIGRMINQSSLNSMPWSKLALEETCTSYAELTREEFNANTDQK